MIRAIKGTRDILPPSSAVWNRIEAISRRVFASYNYQEIRTPIFEETALFSRGVGEETDIVSKEMYSWEDKDGTSITLRPENTASVIRAFIEHRMDQIPGPKKLYYMGPMFRRERPQKGRFRQFFQIGAEVIGADTPATDAEVIEMVVAILSQCGVEGFHLIINSVGCSDCRPGFNAALRDQLQEMKQHLCENCQRRADTNPLRVLDCKVPADQPYVEKLPSILDYLCPVCSKHFAEVRQFLDSRGITYEVRPRLVRGLDYYTRTTFEIVHGALGAQSSVMGGGRYNGLAEMLGSKVPAPGMGFSIGEDRLVMIVEETTAAETLSLDLFIAPMGDAALNHAGVLARDLRLGGVSVEVGEGKLKRLMELANKAGAKNTLILGDNEINAGTYALKNMITGDQRNLTRAELVQNLTSKN